MDSKVDIVGDGRACSTFSESYIFISLCQYDRIIPINSDIAIRSIQWELPREKKRVKVIRRAFIDTRDIPFASASRLIYSVSIIRYLTFPLGFITQSSLIVIKRDTRYQQNWRTDQGTRFSSGAQILSTYFLFFYNYYEKNSVTYVIARRNMITPLSFRDYCVIYDWPTKMTQHVLCKRFHKSSCRS